MNTDELMGWAQSCVSDLYEGPQGQVEQLLCGVIYAQLAVANELKRLNEHHDYEAEVNERLRTLNYMSNQR